MKYILQFLLVFIANFSLNESIRGCFEFTGNSSFQTIEYTTANGTKLYATNFCYMDIDGGGWTLIGRSYPQAGMQAFGWTSHSNVNLLCNGTQWYVNDSKN